MVKNFVTEEKWLDLSDDVPCNFKAYHFKRISYLLPFLYNSVHIFIHWYAEFANCKPTLYQTLL
jgi:hypothetical protein